MLFDKAFQRYCADLFQNLNGNLAWNFAVSLPSGKCLN